MQEPSNANLTAPRRRCINQQPVEVAALPSALLNIRTVVAVTSLSPATVYRRVADGCFPTPIKMGRGCTRWRAAEVAAWVDAQGAGEPIGGKGV